MRLFEAIVDANHRALAGDQGAGLRPDEFADSLPIIALTCIDPRLNPLMPEVLGIPEEKFIWLRNAGNIIFDSMSSMTRTLALACAIKGGREIAVIGHTDCKVGKCSMVELTDRFKALGVERARLPDNINEFFGLFASERQNVMRGVEFVRASPLIGPKVPVHGLLVDITNGKLEWLVNGYQALAAATSSAPAAAKQTAPAPGALSPMAPFDLGQMKFPETPIGAPAAPIAATAPAPEPAPATYQTATTPRIELQTGPHPYLKVDLSALYKILGEDRKVYGPVSGKDLLQWLEEGRIDLKTLAQKLGYKDWKPLAHFANLLEPPQVPTPPSLPKSPHGQKDRKR